MCFSVSRSRTLGGKFSLEMRALLEGYLLPTSKRRNGLESNGLFSSHPKAA